MKLSFFHDLQTSSKLVQNHPKPNFCFCRMLFISFSHPPKMSSADKFDKLRRNEGREKKNLQKAVSDLICHFSSCLRLIEFNLISSFLQCAHQAKDKRLNVHEKKIKIYQLAKDSLSDGIASQITTFADQYLIFLSFFYFTTFAI